MAKAPDVKRVKPFPFRAQLKDARGAYQGQIVKMTLQGLMIEVSGTSVQPGEKVELSFTTPVLHGAVIAAGVVVKVYNQLMSTDATPDMPSGSIHLVEVHYQSVPPESMSNIAMFLQSTGQAKR